MMMTGSSIAAATRARKRSGERKRVRQRLDRKAIESFILASKVDVAWDVASGYGSGVSDCRDFDDLIPVRP
jgi:hypothetical protein